MKQVLTSALALAALASLSISLSSVAAHHSTTMFDHSKTMTINGLVVELRWVNPHVSLSVNGTIRDGEEPALWVMEMTSPGNLVRAGGWRRDAVKPGDRVEVAFSPLRDPEKRSGALKRLVVIDTGEVFTANLREQERPGLE
jgi:Family of unknown function (DUF6152)